VETFYAEMLTRFEELHKNMAKALDGLSVAALDWVPGQDMNPLSVIVAHTAGVERALVGDTVMGEPSVRNREAEMKPQGQDAATLLARLDAPIAYMRGAFEKLTLADLATLRARRDGKQVTVASLLLHNLDHTAEHLGHMGMTRQLWDQKKK
jgi:hypothetical protein